jgi:hypothetical protein
LIAPNPLLNASFGSALPATAAHPSRQLLQALHDGASRALTNVTVPAPTIVSPRASSLSFLDFADADGVSQLGLAEREVSQLEQQILSRLGQLEKETQS